jgi:hypothetical protein
MKREDDQQLWDLLGQTGRPELSPYFARNVVRAVRQEPARFAWLPDFLKPRRLLPAASLAVALIAAVLALNHPPKQKSNDTPLDVLVQIDPQDYDVIADLDELLVADESNLWDDDTQTL